MKTNIGKIIAVIGAPASGKSSLIKNLKENYKIKSFFEGEETDLPEYIKRNIENNENGLQTIIFFHNQAINHYLKALKLKEGGNDVVLDTFWFSNFFYLETMLPDKEERKLIKSLIGLTSKILPLPDIILYIKANDKIIRNRLLQRGRKFENKFVENAIKINKSHKIYLEYKRNIKILSDSKIIIVKAENINYNKIAREIKLKSK